LSTIVPWLSFLPSQIRGRESTMFESLLLPESNVHHQRLHSLFNESHSVILPFRIFPSSPSLEQAIQTTTTRQRAHDSRAYPPARATAAPIVLVPALWRRVAALLRVHGLLLVLHRLLLVRRLLLVLLLAAVVVLTLAWGWAVGSWAAHGGSWGAVTATLLGRVVGAGVLRWVAWGWHVGGFVGHFSWVVVVFWCFWLWLCYRGASLCRRGVRVGSW
jgi:hypothetical protein